ncbi:hypothetical protein DSM106972_098740 [Dulcicalothrix desertica PCC 7102]|uniref:Contractile injection system tube protein N-terminal domain-containing protein n=1 Tax=Dulcicalothrix desertica PCC 7102 TaxID=232991 RepID=A0A3S5K2M8_9CYAN|nr:hypothetical protein [Dulcicalothrix desertica]RUS92558.1 hypothetical protein DSM106972_098740 [Dulcicalothrix desertica PCC 7102]
MPSPSVVTPQKRQPQLEKAKLKAYNGEAPDIELMFNPSEISFSRTVNWQQHPGNRGTTLLPKINFSGVEPYQFILRRLIFDTYETKESVMTYINIIKKGVETIENQTDTRPPVYTFIWKDEYFYCVMVSLTYTLNMFLTDGTPVRAMVDISLQEVDKNNLPGGSQSASQGQQRQNSSQGTSLFNDSPNQSGGGQNLGGGSQNLGGGSQNQGGGNQNQLGGGNQNQGGGNQNQGGGNQNQGGGNQNQGGGNQNQGGGNQNQLGGNQIQLGGNQIQLGGNQNQPGGDAKPPGAGQNQPGAGQNQPGAGQNQPGAGQNQPGGDAKPPGAGQNQPGAGQNQPGGGQNQPGAGQPKPPGAGQNQPGAGQPKPPGGGPKPPKGKKK